MGVLTKFLGTIYYDKLVPNSGATAITSAQIDPQLTQRARITLTSAQILALNTTPITLVAAGGAGTYISVDEVVATLNAGTVAYTGANAANITYTNGSGVAATGTLAAAFLNTTASTTGSVKAVAVAVTTPVVNSPIVISVGTANPGAGNGTMSLDISYRIVTIP